MAVGGHYRLDEIVPRHFVETGARAGMSGAAVEALFAEITATAPAVIDAVMSALPEDFPRDVAESILRGFAHRAKLLAM